ncbi:hypothetical protein NN561_006872 [Cricetulus griseus]
MEEGPRADGRLRAGGPQNRVCEAAGGGSGARGSRASQARVSTGSGTRSQARTRARTQGVPGSQRPAKRAPTFATATRLPAPGREIPTVNLAAASAARCPATERARGLPACLAWRQHATAGRGQQLPPPPPRPLWLLAGPLLAEGCAPAALLAGPSLPPGRLSCPLRPTSEPFSFCYGVRGRCVRCVPPQSHTRHGSKATAMVLAPQPTPSHPA